jgi:DNA-directed RNA polymerase subunit RPC12/RpoP
MSNTTAQSNTITLYVHRCHKCGKPVTKEPTSLKVTDGIVILCSDCRKKELK